MLSYNRVLRYDICEAKSSYIMACYLTAIESSGVLHQDGRRYQCVCITESSQPGFHFCPANNRFIPSDFCKKHIECNDPIYVGFSIAQKSSELSDRVPEFKEDCEDIATNAIKFSVNVLDQCSNTNEVEILLSEQSGLARLWNGKLIKNDERMDRLKYPRIYAALYLNHKEFVSHMYCQQTLRKEWYGGTKWQGQSFIYKVMNNSLYLCVLITFQILVLINIIPLHVPFRYLSYTIFFFSSTMSRRFAFYPQ